jgi:hypothetical protein
MILNLGGCHVESKNSGEHASGVRNHTRPDGGRSVSCGPLKFHRPRIEWAFFMPNDMDLPPAAGPDCRSRIHPLRKLVAQSSRRPLFLIIVAGPPPPVAR